MDKKATEPPVEPVGTDGETLRVFSFAGGGFDTVMQLGVTHALLVNQGKAPDVVVGVSAGAIQGAALAEVIHAGTPPEGKVTADQYAAVLDQRVTRFRQFADACQQAPESIVDAVIPDAYQIDSFEPLASLRLPRLAAEEREERDEWIRRKTGLVRLYNDILSLDLPFGAMTRLTRRALGAVAASALAKTGSRISMLAIETMRLWLLIGTELRRLTPAIPLVARPLYANQTQVRPSTAGSIIFKFRPIEGVVRFITWLWSFLFLLNAWVGLSWLIVAWPFLIVWWLGGEDQPTFLYLFFGLYVLPIVLPLLPFVRTYDKTKFGDALTQLSKGFFAFLFYLAKWTIVLLLLFWLSLPLLLPILEIIPLTANIEFQADPQSGGRGLMGIAPTELAGLLVSVTVILVVGRPLTAFIRAFFAYRKSKGESNVSLGRWYVRRFVDHYHIGPALAHNYNLKRMLVDFFDPTYYGRPTIETVLTESLTDTETAGHQPPLKHKRKALSRYVRPGEPHQQKIVVAVTTADIGDGKMSIVPQGENVVDSLLAATAITPFFSPVWLNKRLVMDAIDIGNTPTKALVELFQRTGLADVRSVDIYPVDPLPVSQPELGPYAPIRDQPFVNLIDIVMRALQLQRYRDANIERRLTDVVSNTIPDGRGTVEVEIDRKKRKFFRAKFVPIELERPPDLNRRIMFGDKTQRRDAMASTIASGCRASLEVMHTNLIKKMAKEGLHTTAESGDFIKCQTVIDRLNQQRSVSAGTVQLPGSGDSGPGLSEICKSCALLNSKDQLIQEDARQCLRLRKPKSQPKQRIGYGPRKAPVRIADWPHELGKRSTRKSGRSASTLPAARSKPGSKIENPDTELPSVACLFSGGVFRGVFQLGVLNALSLLKTKPRIVAGASIGSITAAMVARALSEEDDDPRNLLVSKLAAVYIGIDRIVLTDRFSDFIRNWTIRASESKFSLQQVDSVFRKYDQGRRGVFDKDLRQVLAGIERLFYVNPYQVNRITRLIRNRNGEEASKQLKENVQQWLDRMDVGEELLGAEPIRMLIEEFVLPPDMQKDPTSAPINCIDKDMLFLATTTNLTAGKLKILSSHDSDDKTTLIEGLLASSAFPAVFRPRRSWDLKPGSSEIDQYIDGGVMDNLPLGPVLESLRYMADKGQLPLRSCHGPHLMLAASLETDFRDEEALDLDALSRYWPELGKRAKELKYNAKLNDFERIADNIQIIHREWQGSRPPLYVKVLAVKPRWLCNTFAFHPMLGFRRQTQAQSIAHGCAATLLAIAEQREHATSWKLREEAIPEKSSFEAALPLLVKPDQAKIDDGQCWLQKIKCPFSAPELNRYGAKTLDSNTRSWLRTIHTNCWKQKTHLRR